MRRIVHFKTPAPLEKQCLDNLMFKMSHKCKHCAKISSAYLPPSCCALGSEAPELTMFLLHQVELLHPVGCELIGGNCRESRAVQTLEAEQQHSSSSSNSPARRSRHHKGLTMNIQTTHVKCEFTSRRLRLSYLNCPPGVCGFCHTSPFFRHMTAALNFSSK